MNRRFFTWAAVAASLLLLSGCGRPKTVGAPAPAETAPTPLAAVLAAPADYAGKTVVLRGKVSAQCAALCDFTYAEGAQTATIHTEAEKTPKLATGQPVRVTVAVHSGERNVVLNAVGLELLPRGGTP